MSEIGEKIKTPSQTDPDAKLQGCDWKKCKKNHKKAITYPGGGKYTKGSGYRQAWIGDGMQPWNPKTYGQLRPRLLPDGTSDEMSPPDYDTQGHHLIPTTLFKKTSTLKDNLVLVGYDCDAVENGMMLPKEEENIPLHQLQAHRGNHPEEYMSPIREELSMLEVTAEGLCFVDIEGTGVSQQRLKMALNALSNRAKAKILAIRTGKNFWPVRTRALQEYNDALAEYARREKLRTELLKSQFQKPQGGTP